MKRANYWQPTPVKWRMVGDFALILVPVIQGGLLGAPGLTDNGKYWISFISTVVLTAVKFWTNTKKEYQPELKP